LWSVGRLRIALASFILNALASYLITGEWKGEFSDRSGVWENLLKHKQYDSQVSDLERTMRDDGTFWIDYDSFLMGFSNVDVVLAFRGNCARSFQCNFPEKKSNHRCTRAFEVSLLDPQPGVPSRDTVELYVMGIQKTRRGASHGRVDRKVSYKICDMGILVGDTASIQRGDQPTDEDSNDEDLAFHTVEGEMFGFKRNGHYRLILNRKKHKRLIVMPISFGHPAATDKNRSFALRFVADSPLYIRELPEVPEMDRVLASFVFPSLPAKQQKRKIVLEDSNGVQMYGEPLYRVFQIDCLANQGGIVFVYLCVNDRLLELKGIREFSLDLAIEATCRGMMCRTDNGFLKHETLAKGKKFEAAWRKFNTKFYSEATTRLLMVLVQAGQDSEMGSCTCSKVQKTGGRVQATISSSGALSKRERANGYDELGIFHGLSNRSSNCIHTDGLHASMFGRNAASNSISVGILDVFDLDLERALALSRGDIEMKEALELSMRDKGPFSPGVNHCDGDATNEDRELQLAIERSTAAISGLSSTKTHIEVIDDDINEAIRRSLAETKASSPKQAPRNARDVEVIDLNSMENLDQKPSAKRQKVADESVIEIIDDEEGGGGGEEEEKAKEDSGTSSTTSNKSDTTILTVVERRRLAAEAAEKRFQASAD
jgi:Calpain family cysteine protease